MKTGHLLSVAVLMASLATPAVAQFQKPEDAIKYRKAAFTVMSNHFGRIGAMANGRVPFDAQVAAENAALIESLSKLPFTAFGSGTDKGDTRALPAIWSEQGAFKQAADKMQSEVGKLAAATKTGNLDSVKAAFGSAAQSCKACHDNYRKE